LHQRGVVAISFSSSLSYPSKHEKFERSISLVNILISVSLNEIYLPAIIATIF